MKRAISAFAAALLVNLVGLIVNWRAFADTCYLKWSYKAYGGEIMTEYAFGLRATHHYGMLLGASDTHSLHFSLLMAILFELAWAAVIYGVIALAGRLKPSRRK